jgi:hypothetical protein
MDCQCSSHFLSALVKDWKCITESQSTESASAVAKSLLQKLTIFIIIYALHSLLDYSKICKTLSLPFQRLNFPCVQLSHMYETVSCLESPICSPGQNKHRFVSNTSLNGIYQNAKLHRLCSNVRSFINPKTKI